MTATTAADLVQRAEQLVGELRDSGGVINRRQWESFDQTIYRFLVTITASRRLGPGRVDLEALPLLAVLKDYPAPLAPADQASEYSPTAAARLLGIAEASVRGRVRSGTLPARREGTNWLIPRESLELREDLHPAVHGDPHPLARAACAIGALTDLLVTRDVDPYRLGIDAAAALALAEAVLRVAFEAAEHTITHSDPSDAFRPLQVAQFARRALVPLSVAEFARPLPNVAAPPPQDGGVGPNDRLDAALHAWTRAAHEDLSLSVPSVEVLKNVAAQSVHVLAAIDALVAAQSGEHPGALRDREGLRDCAIALTRSGKSWGPATTGARPSNDYVDAAKDLHRVLQDVVANPVAPRNALAFDQSRALDTLSDATNDLAALARRSSQVSHQLLDAGLLFAPPKAATPTPDRLHARAAGHYVELRRIDLPDLWLKTTAADLEIKRLAAEAGRLGADLGRLSGPPQPAIPLL